MSQRVMFAQGLKPANRMIELHPGQAYLHRFKSACRSYKTDIWVAIILPDHEVERHGLHRRPAEAKPADGAWITPTSERSYPCFLPARNTFRYASIKELFALPQHPPARYADIFGEEDAKLFRKVLKLAKMSPGIDFWVKMADDEGIIKGKRDKEVKLVRPDGYEDIFAAISSGSDVGELSSDEEDLRSENTTAAGLSDLDYGPRKKRKQSSGKSGPFHSGDIIQFPAPGSSTSTPMRQIKHEEQGLEQGQQKEHVLGMNFRQVLNHFLLRDNYASVIEAIFQHAVDVKNQPEAEQICMFLISGHFNPRVVEVKDPGPYANSSSTSSDGREAREVGDILIIGRRLQLQGMQLKDTSDIKNLQKLILSLGRLYKQAQSFDIELLMISAIQKLQIAWNSYPGIYQLRPLLEVVRIVNPVHLAAGDRFREWIVPFMAETYMLFCYDCSKEFHDVMESYSLLRIAVYDRNKETLKSNPEKYGHIQALLQSRGLGGKAN